MLIESLLDMEPDYIELPFDYQTIVGEIATHEIGRAHV